MPYFRADGHMLYYKDFTSCEGNHSGLTFLCIPGLGESHNSFLPVVRNVGDEHRFILFDNCGSGQSRYSGEEVVVEMIAAGAIGILDTLQVTEKVVVIGHGMGALVASSLAASVPARFLALVAIGPVQPTLANTERLEKWIQMVHTDGIEAIADSLPQKTLGSHSGPLHQAFAREMLLNHSRLGFASLCGAVINAPTFDFGEIHVPFLLISSDEDTLAPPEKTFHIFRQVASRQKGMEVLGGVGSWHCIEAGDEISKFILDFTENLRT